MNRTSLPWPVRLRTVLLSVAVVLAPALVPQASSAQQGGLGVIAGTALDSLHGTWLSGAFVTVEGLGRSAVSDEQGEFRIDSIPAGTYRLAVFHPLLDTLALTLMTAPLRVVADSTLSVLVSVPSPSTVLRVKCGAEVDAAVMGSVSRADDPEPPADASVVLRWTEVQVGRAIGVRQTERSLSARVAPDGTFRMCNIEPGVYGELFAISGADTSAAYTASFEEWPVLVIVGFVLAGADVQRAVAPASAETDGDTDSGAAALAAALRVGRAVISGIVVDSAGAPISGVRVSLSGAVGASITSSDGRFHLRDQPSGSGVLTARKIGLAMAEVPVVVSAAGRNEVTVPMTGTVQSLAEVVVRANRQIALERVGFFNRKQRRRGDFFLDPEQMERMSNRSSLAAVLNGANNLTYRQGQIFGRFRPPRPMSMAGGAVTLQGGYSCVAYIVDGQLWRQYGPNDSPVEYILPQEVVAVEVYRAGEAPLDIPYATYARGCETVVIWTRRKLRVQ